MARRRGSKPQAPKRPHLGIKRTQRKKREIALFVEKKKREQGLIP